MPLTAMAIPGFIKHVAGQSVSLVATFMSFELRIK